MKEKSVNVLGKEIKVKELSVAGDLKLQDIQFAEKRTVTAVEVLKQCISEADWEYLNTIPKDVKINEQLLQAMNEVNGWNKGEVSDEKKLLSSGDGTPNGSTS